MSFREILQDIVGNVDGGMAAMVAGMDGIAVDSYAGEAFPLDTQVLGVETAALMREIKRAGEAMRSGGLKELSFITEGMTVIIRALTEEYFAAVVLSPNGNFGKGRYLLRKAEPRLLAEI